MGGMATVCAALWTCRLRVCLKILHPGKAQTDEVKRFEREFLALGTCVTPRWFGSQGRCRGRVSVGSDGAVDGAS